MALLVTSRIVSVEDKLSHTCPGRPLRVSISIQYGWAMALERCLTTCQHPSRLYICLSLITHPHCVVMPTPIARHAADVNRNALLPCLGPVTDSQLNPA